MRQTDIERIKKTLEFYADPWGKGESVPDFYDEMEFGKWAQKLLDSISFEDWNPIETAPKDGAILDLWVLIKNSPVEHSCRVPNAWWSKEQERWVFWGIGKTPETLTSNSIVTHWRACPDGPEEKPNV